MVSFAIIRGLSDRYNMALLNNVVLPSTEPDRKAFAFDVFPSNILDNIVIMKTAQPNLPSEWAGGLIQLNTRDIPEKGFFNASYGVGFNEGTTFKPFATYEGSSTDFLGFDNGKRTLDKNFPGIIALNNLKINGNRDTLVSLGKQINNSSWKVNQINAMRPSQSLQLSGGFVKRFKDVKLGGVFALSYSNTPQYSNGTRTRYESTGEYYYDYNDQRCNTSVATALLASLGAVIKSNHKINWKNIYTINSDNTVYEREGISLFSAVEQRRKSLEFISSKVFNTNLAGEHVFTDRKIKLRWNGGVILINRDQPKTIRYSYERFYTSATPLGPNESNQPFVYQLQNGGSDPKLSAMFNSKLKETVYNAGIDVTVPFNIGKAKQNVSFGYSYLNRTRSFEARNLFFDYTSNNYGSDVMIQEQDVDKIINQANFDNGKLTLNQLAFPQDMYNAKSQTHSAYVMMENAITDRFKAVWGFRFESFSQALTSPTKIGFEILPNDPNPPIISTKLEDSTYTKSYFSGTYTTDSVGKVKNVFPLLPSINLIYKLNENMNLRASYGQSMSRPEFREVSPFSYYDFLKDAQLTGNVSLLQTFIHNVDARYEWFMGKGQSINVSGFYKHFTNTIELTSVAAGGVPQFSYSNGKKAYLVGAELEIRKNLGFITNKLEDLVFTSNVSYIFSQVDLRGVKNTSSDELVRPMQGQSPYIINLGLSYQHPKIGTGVSMLYNQVGDRLYATGEVGNNAWYEHFRPLLDFQVSQRFWKNKGLIRFTISDLIAAKTIFYQNDVLGKERGYQKGRDRVVLSQTNYRTYSIQLSFNF
jgi:TonB-dependent receptor